MANDYVHPPRTELPSPRTPYHQNQQQGTPMHHQPPASGLPPLTGLQAARVDFARRDYEAGRTEDLSQLDAAGLILIVERLRGRLGDMLDLVTEVFDPAQIDLPTPPIDHP